MMESRGFSKGKKGRSTELPTTDDILRTRPFSTPIQKSSEAEKQPPTPESMEKAGAFGYNVASIPLFGPTEAAPIQAKLTIGEPGDKYEEEADTVAAQVVDKINSPATAQSPQGESVQRQAEEETEEVQAQPEISALQRKEEETEEDIQPQLIQKEGEAIGGGEASVDLDSAINSARGGGQPLDAGLQQSMGQAMGADFSGVKVHTDAQSDELNQSIQAKAFTTGQDGFFRQGAYDPGSRGAGVDCP